MHLLWPLPLCKTFVKLSYTRCILTRKRKINLTIKKSFSQTPKNAAIFKRLFGRVEKLQNCLQILMKTSHSLFHITQYLHSTQRTVWSLKTFSVFTHIFREINFGKSMTILTFSNALNLEFQLTNRQISKLKKIVKMAIFQTQDL